MEKVLSKILLFTFKFLVIAFCFSIWFFFLSAMFNRTTGAIVGGLVGFMLFVIMNKNLGRNQCDNVNTQHAAKHADAKRRNARFTS